MNRKAMAIAAAVLGFMSVANFTQKCSALPPPISRNYQWTIEIDTQQIPRQFQYNGSVLTQVVKAQARYFSSTDPSTQTQYETMWYSNGRSLGMERQNKLQIRQGDTIAIIVVHKSGSAQSDEQRAAAKAIMKMVVDANLNKNMVATIKVPIESFSTIAQEFQNYRFSPMTDNSSEDPTSSDLNLFLESVPAGSSQEFAHLH